MAVVIRRPYLTGRSCYSLGFLSKNAGFFVLVVITPMAYYAKVIEPGRVIGLRSTTKESALTL